MSEDTKTPKPGEWWIRDDGKARAYFCGVDSHGLLVYEHSLERELQRATDNWPNWHHEPRCDSFDWVEPEPEPEQAEWSDMAAIQNLDLRRAEMAGRISWAENQAIIQVIAIAKRAIQPVESPDDWVEITDGDHVIRAIDQVNARGNGDGGWYGAFSSIGSMVKDNEYLIVRCRRKDLPVQKRCTCPTLDGIPVTGSACPIHGLPDDSWREVTEAEALARIKPVAIDPGDGWEILPDETMREINDELTDDGGANWQKTNSSGTPIPHDSPYVYRRRIQPMHTTIDVNPGDGYRWLGPEEFVEGTDEVFRPDLNPMWIPPLTRAGYMCCDDDYPVRRRIEPVESPDDWVVQDRVPVRAGDEIRWSNWTDKNLFYEVREGHNLTDNHRHGFVDPEDGLTLFVRCRRRDLPAAKPKRIPVRLYWYDGNIVGRYANAVPTDPSFVEIHSDGESGWYVIGS